MQSAENVLFFIQTRVITSSKETRRALLAFNVGMSPEQVLLKGLDPFIQI